MSATRIRQVKREIRVLGVAVKPSGDGGHLHVVGVVFRGRHWLDGVMRTTAHELDITDRLVDMIIASPHHPQIRVLLLNDALIEGGASIDPYRLSSGASRPVIVLSKERRRPKASGAPEDAASLRSVPDEEVGPQDVLSIGLRSQEAARVLEASTRDSPIPEALRVAGLVASAVADCPERNV